MTSLGNVNVESLVLALTVALITKLGIYLYQKRRRNAIPTEWKSVGTVKNLYIYPLKSGKRIELQKADCTVSGIQLKTDGKYTLRDRCLIIYKESDRELRTARTYPKMVLIQVSSNGPNTVTLNAPGIYTLTVTIPKLNPSGKSDHITLWIDEKIFCIDCGNEAARWVSQYITGQPSGYRLGVHDNLPAHRRNIDKTHGFMIKTYTNLESSAMGLYTDLSSYLLINQHSVDELSKRIPKSNVSHHNFRPNIVIGGEDLKAYDEDSWEWIKIGKVVLRKVKPCTRCTMTTIDPETGTKVSGNEPLKTLITYRKMKDLFNCDMEPDEPVMGVNLGLKREGEIKIGDTVLIGYN